MYVCIYIYAQESVFWPPFPEFVISNLTTFFGSNFINLIRNPDTTRKRQKKTTRNSFFVVSSLSTLSSVICPPKCQHIAPKMWTNYWQSRSQITDHEIWVLNTKNNPNKLSQNTTQIGIWMDHHKTSKKGAKFTDHLLDPLRKKKSKAGAMWTNYWQSLFFVLLQLCFFGWLISFSFLFEFLFLCFCFFRSNLLFLFLHLPLFFYHFFLVFSLFLVFLSSCLALIVLFFIFFILFFCALPPLPSCPLSLKRKIPSSASLAWKEKKEKKQGKKERRKSKEGKEGKREEKGGKEGKKG